MEDRTHQKSEGNEGDVGRDLEPRSGFDHRQYHGTNNDDDRQQKRVLFPIDHYLLLTEIFSKRLLAVLR